MDNPSYIAYEKIWELLGDCSASGVTVAKGNLVDYSQLTKDKPQQNTADLPEIRTVLGGDRWDTTASNSSERGLIQQYDLRIETGVVNLAQVTSLKWYVYQVIESWTKQGGNTNQMLYRGEVFCRRLQYQSTFEGFRRSSPANDQITGWASVITIDAYFKFSRNQLEIQ